MVEESQMIVDEVETTDSGEFTRRLLAAQSLVEARAAFSDILVDVVRDSSKVCPADAHVSYVCSLRLEQRRSFVRLLTRCLRFPTLVICKSPYVKIVSNGVVGRSELSCVTA